MTVVVAAAAATSIRALFRIYSPFSVREVKPFRGVGTLPTTPIQAESDDHSSGKTVEPGR
ncbi:hypothetical protein [Streptomyces collinus]|uniref:hypothetical protein n=1 Tax=Streptomyces collinus TaxID=42684 RepID=UPI002943AF2B|nr:hypothetical protein [Streptomyces collinus]